EGGAVNVEVKDGILYINGEAQELNDEVGSKVVVVDNGNGTYTLTVDGTSIVLPKASASVAIAIVSKNDQGNISAYNYFTNLSKVYNNNAGTPTAITDAEGGILWGTADKYKGDWKGLKSVEKGKLLVGQISNVNIKVSPATFDLTTAKLTLVNTLGEEAPVTVTPVVEGKKGPQYSGSRAADENGNWSLQIAMTDDVTASNIGTAFAGRNTAEDYAYQNVQYALAIDGKVVTPYEIVVDTQESKDAGDFTKGSFNNVVYNYKKDGVLKSWVNDGILPLGETTLLINSAISPTLQTAADKIYDAYIEVMDEDALEDYNITVSGMTINASNKAAGVEKFPIKIHVMDVNGNEVVSDELNIKFDNSVVDEVTFPDQTCVFMPTTAAEGAFILVDMGDIFTSMTAEEANAVSGRVSESVTWYTTVNTKTFATVGSTPDADGLYQINLANTGNNIVGNAETKVFYYASKEDALKDALKGDEDLAIKVEGGLSKTIRTIKYAAIPASAFKSKAFEGANDIIIKMLDKDGNEVKKATATVTVALPAFDDILDINNTQKLWNDAKDTYTTRFDWDNNSTAGLKISMQKPFVSKKDVNGTAYFDINDADSKLYYELSYTDVNKKDQVVPVANAKFVSLPNVVKDGKLMHDVEVTATLYPFGEKQVNLKLTKTFKLYVQSVFEGAELIYYVDDVKQDVVTLGNDQCIAPGTTSGKKNGLYVAFDGEERPYVFAKGDVYAALTEFNNGTRIAQSQLNVQDPTGTASNDDVIPALYLGEGASGVSLSLKEVKAADGKKDNVLYFNNVSGSTSGTVIFNFVDNLGVKYPVTISYKK
uniref:hypothetical protein n=1 Tax=Phocaeicola barnesiae TaxID=376804 RepID=UPI00036952F9